MFPLCSGSYERVGWVESGSSGRSLSCDWFVSFVEVSVTQTGRNVCVSVEACVCERERERDCVLHARGRTEGGREGDKQTNKQRETDREIEREIESVGTTTSSFLTLHHY